MRLENLYREIEALGGATIMDDYDEGYADGLNEALAVLRKYGFGVDMAPEPEWRPIKDAPKDGSTFLAITRVGTSRQWVSQCKWVGPDARYPTANLDWFMGVDGWPQPTHWMPLPNPPKEETT